MKKQYVVGVILILLAGIGVSSVLFTTARKNTQKKIEPKLDQVAQVAGTIVTNVFSPVPSATPSQTPNGKIKTINQTTSNASPVPSPSGSTYPIAPYTQPEKYNYSNPTDQNLPNQAEIDDINKQLADLRAKQEYCKVLYAEVRANLEPSFQSRDKYLELAGNAIGTSAWDNYWKEYKEADARIQQGFQTGYYSVCP
jgi:hypothetical protein